MVSGVAAARSGGCVEAGVAQRCEAKITSGPRAETATMACRLVFEVAEGRLVSWFKEISRVRRPGLVLLVHLSVFRPAQRRGEPEHCAHFRPRRSKKTFAG